MFNQITILGPGLLGASLAMAVKKHLAIQRIVIWARSPESRTKCQKQEWCDAVFETPEEAVVGSDLVILCTPVQTIVPLLKQIQPALTENALVSDVGSTKALICRGAHFVFNESSATFLGSHPMAGSEQTGMEHASSDLFKDAACILTPLPDTPTEITEALSSFWRSLGMTISTFSPEAHDKIVAHVSHLPHLLASTLCTYLEKQESAWQALGGNGLRDTTRVASGDPQLWKQILEQNSNEILQAIDGFERQLNILKAAIIENDSTKICSLLKQGKRYRDQL